MSPSYTRYFIPLGKSVLIFFPSSAGLTPIQLYEDCQQSACPEVAGITEKNKEKIGGYVVQVTVKHAKVDVISEITAFFLAQYDITKAIESILFAHIFALTMPPEIRIEGAGYVLLGKRRPWEFGRTLQLAWGNDLIRPCDDKWTFNFELTEASQ